MVSLNPIRIVNSMLDPLYKIEMNITDMQRLLKEAKRSHIDISRLSQEAPAISGKLRKLMSDAEYGIRHIKRDRLTQNQMSILKEQTTILMRTISETGIRPGL